MTRTILVLEIECEHGKARPHRPPGATRMCFDAARYVLNPRTALRMYNGFVFTVDEVLDSVKQLEFDRNGVVI